MQEACVVQSWGNYPTNIFRSVYYDPPSATSGVKHLLSLSLCHNQLSLVQVTNMAERYWFAANAGTEMYNSWQYQADFFLNKFTLTPSFGSTSPASYTGRGLLVSELRRMWKFCSSWTKTILICSMASLDPIHLRGPMPKGSQANLWTSSFSLSRNLKIYKF